MLLTLNCVLKNRDELIIAKPTNHPPIGGAPEDILSPAVMHPVRKHIVTLPRTAIRKAEGIGAGIWSVFMVPVSTHVLGLCSLFSSRPAQELLFRSVMQVLLFPSVYC